jgi:tetratricopeptide (TPR) repeat protein
MARLLRSTRVIIAAYVVFVVALIAAFVALVDKQAIIYTAQRFLNPPPVAAPQDAARLLADVQRFRADMGTMEPAKAADDWLALYDRAAGLGVVQFDGTQPVFDREVTEAVGVKSVLASLPGPGSWPVLRERAVARASAAPADSRAIALRLLADMLGGDAPAARASLAAVEARAQSLSGPERDASLAAVGYLRATLARLYGSPAEVADSFAGSLAAQAKRPYGQVAVPDLVGLVGEAKAATILRDALVQPAKLRVAEGDRTRALARRIALEEIERLKVPQWGLVDTMEAADLYEALARRFAGGASLSAPDRGFDSGKSEADTYYFLHLVVHKRHADAEKALQTLTGQNALYLPRGAIDALQRAGYNAALYAFLHDLLGRRPAVRAWEVYTRQAAYTGHAAEPLALVETQLKRKDLPDNVLAELRFHRVGALLAADRVEPAVADLRQLLSAPPMEGEPTLQSRSEAALRLAGLGRVLGRDEASAAGIAFANAVVALPSDQRREWQRDRLLKDLYAELRKQGRAPEAQALALTELERRAKLPVELERYGAGLPSGGRTALVELAALHEAAGRHKEVLALLDESKLWGAGDLATFFLEKDSLGVPMGLIAARALAQTGQPALAVEIARAVAEAQPGYDPAFELLAALDKDAYGYLKSLYARDRFEERPLIWMAIVLHRQGRTLEAEALIRQAIVIDPSDGEEGPTDRMRAYAVLAEILDAKGDKGAAQGFRNAVKAIRISERSDELHKLGLYERAFAGYREALGHFADAYCVQSRLAVRLYEQGRRTEALEHYRRAYELMPASFGRVESHCFGCESVFQGPEQQRVAEQVFTGFLAKEPNKPQVHYLLGYLEKERGLHAEALKRFNTAVSLDPEYLNAWKHLHELAAHVYIEPRARDAVRMKLLELDPEQRHVRYELAEVGDLAGLWRAVEAANASAHKRSAAKSLYALRASAAAHAEILARLPESERNQMAMLQSFMAAGTNERELPTARRALARHSLVTGAAPLLGAREYW